jgi:hypothetical protein
MMARMDRLQDAMTSTRDDITSLRSGFLDELGKTRAALMARMQDVRDDVTARGAGAAPT